MNTNLQKKLFELSSKIYIDTTQNSGPKVDFKKALDLLLELTNQNYKLTNPEFLFELTDKDFDKVKEQIISILSSQEITAYKLRDSFGKSVNLEKYTDEEWTVIFAQYSLTYGWDDKFKYITGLNPHEVVYNYANKYDFKNLSKIDTSKIKEITLINRADLSDYVKSIMESPIPLRNDQVEILEAVPYELLQQPVDFKIRATEALVNNILYKNNVELNITDINSLMRFILNNGQKGSNNEDYNLQITKPMLKSFKFHLPTKMKKLIWGYLEKQPVEKTVEQMFKYEQWWKRCLHHAHWCSADKFNKRYPNSKKILNKLYSSDRSWTFNARYSLALKNNRYDKVVEILTERPGLLFRNIVMLCKYTTGVELPVKLSDNNVTKIIFNDANNIVQYDASEWLINELPKFLRKTNPSIKLLWQAIEELTNSKHEKPIYERVTQGHKIVYKTPIPAINKPLRDRVINTIKEYIKEIKHNKNKSLGKVYLDPSIEGIAVQYSGATSSESTKSGKFYPPGSVIKLPDNVEIIRLGVVWKDTGNGSCDIDLSTGAYTYNEFVDTCCYSNPELEVDDELIAVSSGDITSCSSSVYSAEFIDIDVKKSISKGVIKYINHLNMFSGETFDKYDTHVFVSFINTKDRIIASNKMKIDLAKQDYAIKINEASKSHIGVLLDLSENVFKVINLKIRKNFDDYGDVNYKEIFDNVMNNMDDKLKIIDILKESIDSSQLVDNPEDADITIGTSPDNTIDVTTDMEKVNSIIF